MNYAGAFDFRLFGNASGDESAGAVQASAGASIVVNDAQLLFSGDFRRSGVDLVLSRDGQEHVVTDYFKGPHRAALNSPDGAMLSPDLVKALVGEVQVAQAGGTAAAAQVIGTVSKLTGSATAIRNGVSVTLNVGDQVQKGDVVQAGADSSLNLTFIDGTVFGLSANARMVLNEMVYDPQGSSNNSLLSLIQGTITFVAGETAKNGDMRVDTPVATMGIRGTAVLVEIGFEVPGQGGAPVKFQVLVEPDGRVGSYVLYSKSSGQAIGSVNQAGQVTSVTGGGNLSTAAADPLSALAQSIIQQTLQQYFPNYVPSANPRSGGPGGGSAPADPNNGTSPDPLQFIQPDDLLPGQPFRLPINLPGTGPNIPPIDVTLIRYNSAPTITVAPIVATLPVDSNSFNIGNQVTIIDPDVGDVATPYVPGTARIVSATGPTGTPASLDLKSLVSLDPQTGQVTYDPAAFAFLAAGQKAVYTIAFNSQSGPDTTQQTLTFTVDGTNDAPVIVGALTGVVAAGATVQSFDLLANASDPDLGETATLSINHVTYALGDGPAQSGAPAGVTLQGTSLQVDASAFAYLGAGETQTLVVSYDIVDAHGALVHQTERLTIAGANDAPIQVTGSVVGGMIDVPAVSGSVIPGVSGSGLVNGLGGAAGYGEFVLASGDDNSSSAIGITSVFGPGGLNFFGHNYTELYINNNGNITFGSALGTYTPSEINGGSIVPIIAAFWADVDTRSAGHVYYDLDPVSGTFTVTWDHVGYYSNGTDKLNSFQLQLINRGNGNFDIVYRYDDIQWTTGGASGGNDGLGGTPAYIGYSAGDGVHYYQAPESGEQNALLHIENVAGNTGYNGVDGYEVRNGVVQDPALKTQGTINFSDADLNDVHTASIVPAEGRIGTLTLVKLSDTTGTGTGGQFGWVYTVDAALARAALQQTDGNIVETFTVVIDDGHGGAITQTVSVTLAQPVVNQAPVIDTTHVETWIGETGMPAIAGISVSDADAAGHGFNYAATSDHGGHVYFNNGLSSGHANSLAELNELLNHATTYEAPAGAGGQETVRLTITDHQNASDHVNFVFHLGAVSPGDQLQLAGSNNAKDVIVATAAMDTLTGGTGADQFVFGSGSGHDRINDFEIGTDKIDLRMPIYYAQNEHSFAEWLQNHSETTEAGTLIHLDPAGTELDSNTILVKGVTGLQASDFIVHPLSV